MKVCQYYSVQCTSKVYGRMAHLAYLEGSPPQASHIRGTQRPKREGLFETDEYTLRSPEYDQTKQIAVG